jgi:hypothetical protein
MKNLILGAMLLAFTGAYANEPTTAAQPQTAQKVSRKEAKEKCHKANPGLKGKALRECVKKELH